MGKQEKYALLLAVTPTSTGLGFALFENAKTPLDWGVKQMRVKKDESSERHVEALIRFYQPDTLVVESISRQPTRLRARRLNANFEGLATLKGLSIKHYSRSDIKAVFGQFGPVSKYGISRTIAEWLPELSSKVPRYRKPWMNEDYSMTIFDAVALALTHYYVTD